jgi:hypothetical protein
MKKFGKDEMIINFLENLLSQIENVFPHAPFDDQISELTFVKNKIEDFILFLKEEY